MGASEFDAGLEQVRLIFAHDDQVQLWEAETSTDVYEERPAVATPSTDNAGSMFWRVAGAYESGSDDVTLHQVYGGYPGSRATFAWSTGGGDPFGCDEPTIVTHVENVTWTSAVVANSPVGNFDVVEAGDGSLVAVTAFDEANNGDVVQVWRKPVGGSWSSVGLLTWGGATNIYSAGKGAFPALVRVPSGAVLLFLQRHYRASKLATQERMQVEVWRAEPDADWSTPSTAFSKVTDNALETAVSEASTDCGEMTAAYGNGQVLLLVSHPTTAGYYRQYASTDGGASFSLVENPASLGTNARVKHAAGYFLVLHRQNGNLLASKRLGDARQALSSVSALQMTSGGVDDVMPALAVEDTGRAWAYAWDGSDIVVFSSPDGGATWDPPAGSEVSVGSLAESTGQAPECTLAAAWWRGRAVLLTGAPGAKGSTSYEQSLVALHLGGWGQFTMPEDRDTGYPGARYITEDVWLPVMDLTRVSAFTVTTAGSPTQDWASGGGWQVTSSSGDTWRVARSGTATWAVNARDWHVVANVTSGTARHDVVGTSYAVRVDQTASGFTVTDLASGLLTTVAITGDVELHIILDEVQGELTVAYREHDGDDAREFTVYTSSLSSASFTAFSRTEHISTGTNEVMVLKLVGGGEIGPVYDWTPSLPYGRRVSALPQWVTNGIRVAGAGGLAVAGDEWAIESGSLYAVEQAAATPDYPSPRQRFESATDTGTKTIAWWWGAASNRPIPTPVWGIYLDTDAQIVIFDWYVNGTGWTGGHFVKVEEALDFDWDGDAAVPASTSSTPLFVEEDELAGGYLTDGFSGSSVAITGNRAGALTLPSTGSRRQATLFLDDTVTTTTTKPSLVPPRAIAILSGADVPAEAQGFRIRLAGFPPEGRMAAKVACGPAYLLGDSHGKDTRRRHRAMFTESRAENGWRQRRSDAPTEETIELFWQDIHQLHMKKIREDEEVAYLADDAGSPAYARGEVISTLRALIERWSATGRPVIYVPRFDLQDGTASRWRLRGGGVVLGTIDEAWDVDHRRHGVEYVNDVLGGGMLRIRELT